MSDSEPGQCSGQTGLVRGWPVLVGVLECSSCCGNNAAAAIAAALLISLQLDWQVQDCMKLGLTFGWKSYSTPVN